MSEKNTREEARVLIKKMTDFDITHNYYQKDLKDEIARDFKKLLEIDDPTVRKFLERWISTTKEVARDFDLMGTEVEVDKAKEEKTSEEEGAEIDATEEEEAKDKEREETETSTEEVSQDETPTKPKSDEIPSMPEHVMYLKRVNELLY